MVSILKTNTMKTIKLLIISIVLTTIGCSTDEETARQQDCDCVTTIYRIKPGVGGYQWFQTGLDTDDELNCDDAMDSPQYYAAPNYFYQVECN